MENRFGAHRRPYGPWAHIALSGMKAIRTRHLTVKVVLNFTDAQHLTVKVILNCTDAQHLTVR